MEEILHQAERLEKDYDWLGAAGLYEKVLSQLPHDDFSKMGEIHERLGYASYRFAFQAETNEEFRDRLQQSTVAYEKAAEFYEKSNESVKAAKESRCNAMIAYVGYWLAREAQERKKKIDECWELTKEALAAFKEAGEGWEYGKTYNHLSSSVVFAFCLNWDFQARQKMIGEAVESGEQAIRFLSASEDLRERARGCARTAFFLGIFDYYFLDLNEKQRDNERIQNYWREAKELSEDVALQEFLYPIFGPHSYIWGEHTKEAITNVQKALEYGKKTRDKLILGFAFDWLVYHGPEPWTSGFEGDPERIARALEARLQIARDARRQFAPISFISPRTDVCWIETYEADHYHFLSYNEMDLKKRRDLREKAREGLPEGLKRAEASGSPEAAIFANHMFGYVLFAGAELETNPEVKKRFLEEGLEHEQEAARITDMIQPLDRWNRGIFQGMPTWAEGQLADLAQDPETKKNMLLKALAHKENGLKLCLEEARVLEKQFPASFGPLGDMQRTVGSLSNRLYELTGNKEHLRKAAKAFVEAVDSFQKVDEKKNMAESQWKAALAYDALDEHLKAAENFELASDNYKSVSGMVPQLKDFYQEYAAYMAAWNEIEKARHHHERQEYGLAKEHFRKAAHLHQPLRKWGYLEKNYLAWVQVESAEELSKEEHSEEAIKSFGEASKLFGETKKSLRAQLSKIEDVDEKQMVDCLIGTSDLRREYCDGRIAIEEAKILDKTGDHLASSGKYGSAAEIFERIGQTLESEQERKDFRSLTSVSRAWQKMMLGDAKASPELYLEASALFEQASKESNSEVTGLLALGHSRFCKALEAGTRFADTGDTALYTVAMQNLEIAAKYYVKAGFQSASEYATATGLLLEAYVHMASAKDEKDPEKKTKLYLIAEKVLQTSAGSFMKAEHPEKREQVLRLLEKVRKERELALSIAEVLHTPTVVSTTTSFAAPTPTSEEAVGSERFEHADVQANLLVRQKELRVGESVELEIEFVNAGKGPALLVKVTEVIPEGFEIVEKPEACRIEDSFIDMKGRRLDTLKTGELRLVLKPKVQGTFSLKPTILYLDENGKYKSHELEKVTILVKELGIKGWLKGGR